VIGVDIERAARTFWSAGRRITAVSGASAQLEPGTFTSVVGASGCGKTTLLRLIAGLIELDGGRITLGGKVELHRRHHAALVFQDARLLPWLSVEKNLLLALRREQIDADESRSRVREALQTVGMERWSSASPHQLSGGMAQRVNLARALCQRRDLWLLDEPFSALDAINRRQLQDDLLSIWRERRPTVLLVTHDVAEAVLLSDRVLTMAQGSFVADRPIDIPRPRDTLDADFVNAVAVIHTSLVTGR
jgi:sulfonate transport system ATP-binding protein